MISLKGIARNFTASSLLAFSLLWLSIAAAPCAAKALPLVAAPVIVAQQPTDWVGSTKASFRNVLTGKIFYTLDGSDPTNKDTQYQAGNEITIDHSLTLKGVHILSGNSSEVASMDFTRAKLPAPVAKYGGKTGFYPSLLCSLQVARAGITPAIRYTLDGTAPGPLSTLYSAPIKIEKTGTLRAYAIEAGYDDSEPLQVAFTLLEPPAKPAATPPSGSFASNTLKIKLTSQTTATGLFFRYTTDKNLKNMDSAAIVGGDSVSILGGKVGDTTTLRVIACRTGYPSSAVTTEKYVYLPAVAAPTISPPAGYFYDSITVFLSGPAGANVRYVMDNSVITSTSLDGSKPIFISSGTTLKAQAFNPPQPPSNILTVPYTLRLTPPDFDKQSQEYVTSLNVRITSKSPKSSIYYTLNGAKPTTTDASPLTDTSGIVAISAPGETILKAVTYKDGIYSEVDSAVYTQKAVIQKLSAPVIEPAAREFEDNLTVTIRTTETNAEIHYTTDGSDPTLASSKYTAALKLDSTTVLRAQSFPTQGTLVASVIREERYTLTPSPPIATPPANTAYPNSVLITLKTNTKNGVIKYLLGDTPLAVELTTTYVEGHPILLTSSTRLQALTALTSAGATHYSAPLDVNYDLYTNNTSDSLAPGSLKTLTAGITFTNASDQPITAQTHTTEAFTLPGFRDASLAVLLQPAQAGQAIKVVYSKPAGQTAGLYRYSNGVVEFITAENQATLTAAGDYFVGVDTLPPSIQLLIETALAGDSTTIRLSVRDNVLNPSCEIQSPGLAGGKLTLKPDANGEVKASLKLPGADLKSLWFRATSTDAYNTGRLPADPAGKVFLTQVWSKVNTPSVLSMGRANSAWDLAGFPIGSSAPLTWKRLRDDNSAGNLDAARWSEAIQDYVYLDDSSSIKAGMAFWIGSRTSLSTVALSGFQTAASETDGTYRMLLHPGWNQVTSPSLDRIYWPTTLAATKSPTVYVKAPYRYLPEKDDYVQCDSLDPWKGYFVHFFGTHDTTITLYTDLSKRPAGKLSAQGNGESGRGAFLSLDFGRTMPLILGARTDGRDGVGAEDEPDLPPLNRSFTAWSQRGMRHLLTDVVHFAPGEVLHWNVVLADRGNPTAGTPGSGKFTVAEGSLPAGYEAWAVSSARGMKFPLQPGQELPLSGTAGDTLSIYAGPLGKLAGISEFAHAALSVDQLSFNLERNQDGNVLKLALPWIANVDVGVWSPDGRLLATAHPGRLNQGIYRLALAGSRNSSGAGPQIGFLRIRLNGEAGARELSQKVIW